MRYSKYNEYKATDIAWLGDVPSHWETWKIAHGFQITGSGTTPPSDNPEWYDGDVCWVTTGELREKVILDTEKKVSRDALSNFSALKVFPKGSLAIAMYGATIGRLGIFGVDAATNQACCVLYGQKVFGTMFTFYWLQAFRDQIILLASGGGQPNISQEKVRSIRIACPSTDEQQAIARFLDTKTALIDALVAQKRELINKLKEKRSALITRTVTHGLPLNACGAIGVEQNQEMKDSGVAWLGKIPVTWSVERLRRVCLRVTDGAHISPDLSSNDFPFVSTVDIADGKIDMHKCLRTSTECYDYLVRNGCKPFFGDVLFSKDGTVGRTAVIDFSSDFVVASSLVIISPNKKQLDFRFLDYWLNNSLLQQEVALQMAGAAIRRVSIEKVGRLPVVLPPLEEQRAIVSYLHEGTKQLDALVLKTETVINRLTEYRQALITSAVTGKIDVREVA